MRPHPTPGVVRLLLFFVLLALLGLFWAGCRPAAVTALKEIVL